MWKNTIFYTASLTSYKYKYPTTMSDGKLRYCLVRSFHLHPLYSKLLDLYPLGFRVSDDVAMLSHCLIKQILIINNYNHSWLNLINNSFSFYIHESLKFCDLFPLGLLVSDDVAMLSQCLIKLKQLKSCWRGALGSIYPSVHQNKYLNISKTTNSTPRN